MSVGAILTIGFGSFSDVHHVVTLGYGTAAAAPPTPSPNGGGRGGVANWGGGYKYPYAKWWKKQKAKELAKLKAEAEKKIAKLEVRVERARDTVELQRTIEAIARAKEALARLETSLQEERDRLAELELLEVTLVWNLYHMMVYD